MAEHRGPGSGAGWGTVPLRAATALLLVSAVVAAGCKTPRTPHRTTGNDVSGSWSSQSTQPLPLGWSFRLDQGDAGKLTGTGTVNDGARVSVFQINGVRGPREITMEFDLDGAETKFDGSVMDVDLIVGRAYMNGDTIKLTLERQ